jgi:hypothetical protein
MAIVLGADGSTRVLEDISLESLQKAVGGYIEAVRTRAGRLMYINEEGKLHGLRVNKHATQQFVGGRYDVIVGDAVVLTEEEERRSNDAE